MNWNSSFDLEGIVVNLLSDTIFFIATIPVVLIFLPDLAIRLIKRANSRYLTLKLGAVLRELCNFLGNSQFQDFDLNAKYLAVTTKRKDIKNFRFVAMSCINVMNLIVFPKVFLVVANHLERMNVEDKYRLVQSEFKRLSFSRHELERICLLTRSTLMKI